MIRLAIVVEGSTEEEFVTRLLYSHLLRMDVHIHPFLLGGRGGNVTVAKLAFDMWNYKASHDAVTSFVDFYGFRDKGSLGVADLTDAVLQAIETRTSHKVDGRSVVPYVQKHEFEGLLFSDVSKFSFVGLEEGEIMALQQVRSSFPNPEEINDDKHTAPSKRIRSVFPRYRKRVYGPLVVERIGLSALRAECPGFDNWLTRLEALPENLSKTPT